MAAGGFAYGSGLKVAKRPEETIWRMPFDVRVRGTAAERSVRSVKASSTNAVE